VTGRYSNQLNYQTNDFISKSRDSRNSGIQILLKNARLLAGDCKYTVLIELRKQFDPKIKWIYRNFCRSTK
jgi:hypothetical protein